MVVGRRLLTVGGHCNCSVGASREQSSSSSVWGLYDCGCLQFASNGRDGAYGLRALQAPDAYRDDWRTGRACTFRAATQYSEDY